MSLDYINLNIKHLVDREGIGIDAFGALFGLNRGAIGSYIAGKATPKIETIQKISAKYGVLIDDLINKNMNEPSKVSEDTLSYEARSQMINHESKGVPYYDVDFIGGMDIIVNDDTTKPLFYIDFPHFNDAHYWINITGKSMSPFISHGDIVALQRLEGWKDFLLYGEIYAIVTEHFRTIKIVGKGTKEDCISLIPYNKSQEFSVQDLPMNLIKHIFKVKGSIKKFF